MKAVVLLSGGLDSTLAMNLIKNQGVETVALHFSSPFCRCDGKKGCGSNARSASELAGVKLKNVFLTEEYLEIVKNPKHGRGKNLNPCIDCRILKFSKAKQIMEEEGASFIVTGEVLGQRPMSQRRNAMDLIERESGLKGLVVRPLSSKVLRPSIQEEKGWVDRDKFMAFTGRSRKPQFKLADELNINDYPCPAGGCLLTDPNFCRRLKDVIKYSELTMKETMLLMIGRHFRLTPEYKLIVGRNESENKRLLALKEPVDLVIEPIEEMAGPVGLGRGHYNKEVIKRSAGIVARYIDNAYDEMPVVYKTGSKNDIIKVKNFSIKKA